MLNSAALERFAPAMEQNASAMPADPLFSEDSGKTKGPPRDGKVDCAASRILNGFEVKGDQFLCECRLEKINTVLLYKGTNRRSSDFNGSE